MHQYKSRFNYVNFLISLFFIEFQNIKGTFIWVKVFQEFQIIFQTINTVDCY